MNEYEIASLSLQEASLNLQEIVTWGTIAYTTIAFMTFCLIGYGIWTMNRSNNRRSDDLNALNERIFHADERRHKEAMAAHTAAMAAHKEAMAAHKAAREESMEAHQESMAALKALIANGEKTSEALVEMLRRTNPDGPAAPEAAN